MGGGGSGTSSWPKTRRRPPTTGGVDECALAFLTVLNSPDEGQLKLLKIDGELEIAKLHEGNGERLVAKNGRFLVGAIIHPLAVVVRRCMDAGNHYQATIRSISGKTCKVEVHRVSR